jgi:CheY-like chemotaxis protein
LLVEDEPTVREHMSHLLSHHGYRVHQAGSGNAALEVWKTHRHGIDLLITDMVMPGDFTGRELATVLRSDKPGLKVIYCSGYTDEVLGADSLLRDSVNFINKPFEFHQLLDAIGHCFTAAKEPRPVAG